MSQAPNLTLFRRAFVDVCRGYSIGEHEGKKLYIKHLSHFQHLSYDDKQATYHAEAVAKGALTEEDRLSYLIKNGQWSDAKEKEIAVQRDTIIRFEEGKKALLVPSHIKRHEEDTQKEREKLVKMLVERGNLMGITAEVYAQQRLNDFYTINNLFSDEGLTLPFLTEDSFEDLGDSMVEDITSAYNRAVEPCSDTNLRKLSVQDFFVSYYALCGDSAADFFGTAVANLTFYQIRLCSFARYYKHLLEHTDINRIPREQRNDPEAIDRAFTSQKNSAGMIDEGKVPTNMTQEDVKALGLEGQMTRPPQRNMNAIDYLKHLKGQSGN